MFDMLYLCMYVVIYVSEVFHGGPPEEDPVSEERSDLHDKGEEKCKFVLFIQKLLIIYRGSQGGRGVSGLKKGAARIKLFQMCMGIVINILQYNILRLYVATQLSLNSTSKISWI